MSLKSFFTTLFIKQNKYHKYSVLVHTLRVTEEVIKAKRYDFIAAALLHDIGKPFAAYQKPEDIETGEYSFTDHEEKSYQIIKNWFFISEYSKKLVRYHYIIRDIQKRKEKADIKYVELEKTFDSFEESFKKDLYEFMRCDDLGKQARK